MSPRSLLTALSLPSLPQLEGALGGSAGPRRVLRPGGQEGPDRLQGRLPPGPLGDAGPSRRRGAAALGHLYYRL